MVYRKRVQVVFTGDQWAIVEKFRGALGVGDSELVRNIVLAWLSEKSMISSTVKKRAGLGWRRRLDCKIGELSSIIRSRKYFLFLFPSISPRKERCTVATHGTFFGAFPLARSTLS